MIYFGAIAKTDIINCRYVPLFETKNDRECVFFVFHKYFLYFNTLMTTNNLKKTIAIWIILLQLFTPGIGFCSEFVICNYADNTNKLKLIHNNHNDTEASCAPVTCSHDTCPTPPNATNSEGIGNPNSFCQDSKAVYSTCIQNTIRPIKLTQSVIHTNLTNILGIQIRNPFTNTIQNSSAIPPPSLHFKTTVLLI